MFFDSMHPSFQELLNQERELLEQIEAKLSGLGEITPERSQVMRAFGQDLSNLKVVIIGQDPYPSQGVANGLAFMSAKGVPASLRNLMIELSDNYPELSHSGDLASWHSQGVMLLNASLTTEVGLSGKHMEIWSDFTSNAIARIDEYSAGKLVFVALGGFAKRKLAVVRHSVIIEATHPSPLSAHRGFFGSKIYLKVNQALIGLGMEPIDWSC